MERKGSCRIRGKDDGKKLKKGTVWWGKNPREGLQNELERFKEKCEKEIKEGGRANPKILVM